MSQRDDRRRRMMTANADQTAAPRRLSPHASVDTNDANTMESRGYTDAALPENQPRVLDFVPLSRWKATALLITVVTLVLSLVTMHIWLPAKLSLDLTGTSLDLAAPVGFATWLASVILLASSALALVIYSVRNHKLDDYKGRYRVWRQAAILWLVLSVVAGSNCGATIELLLNSLTGGKLAGNAALWWALPVAALVGYITPALLSDLSRCRLGSTALVSAVFFWAFAVASKLGWVPLDAAEQPRIEASSLLAGHCLLLISMTLYARFVIREAQGLIFPRQKKSPVAKPAERVESEEDSTDSSPPKPTKRLLLFGRGKTARIDTAHESDDREQQPHVATREIANSGPLAKRVRRTLDAATVATVKPVANAKTTPMLQKKASVPETLDDPVADEVARLEGLGGRLSKAQRKKLRKLRRQAGDSDE